MATIPGISPNTIGAPTFRISVSWIGPLPARQLYFSVFIYSRPANWINVNGETSFIQSDSHLPQPKQSWKTLSKTEKSASFAKLIPSTSGKSLGQFLWQFPQPLHLIAISWHPFSSGTPLLPFRIGLILIAVSAATSPAFIGSKIKTPSIFPLTKSSTISIIGSSVLSGNPPIIFSFVVM